MACKLQAALDELQPKLAETIAQGKLSALSILLIDLNALFQLFKNQCVSSILLSEYDERKLRVLNEGAEILLIDKAEIISGAKRNA